MVAERANRLSASANAVSAAAVSTAVVPAAPTNCTAVVNPLPGPRGVPDRRKPDVHPTAPTLDEALRGTEHVDLHVTMMMTHVCDKPKDALRDDDALLGSAVQSSPRRTTESRRESP